MAALSLHLQGDSNRNKMLRSPRCGGALGVGRPRMRRWGMHFKLGCRSKAAVPLLRLHIRTTVPDGFVELRMMVKPVRLRVKPGGATIPFLQPVLLA